jgi:hypothetical protein
MGAVKLPFNRAARTTTVVPQPIIACIRPPGVKRNRLSYGEGGFG